MPADLFESHPHRMRDLVRLTGLPAPTIHFYGQQGLLPAAHKTAGNQARYSADAVGRILWVRSLQQDLRLPLRTIRWVLDRWGELPVDEIQALQTLGSLLEEPDPAASAEELARGLDGIGPHDLDHLRAMDLVAPPGHPLTSSDARLIELIGAMRAAGLTEEAGFRTEALGLYRDSVQHLVEEELQRIVEPALHLHDMADLHLLVRRAMPLVHQLLALLHQRAVQREMQRWLEVNDPAAENVSA